MVLSIDSGTQRVSYVPLRKRTGVLSPLFSIFRCIIYTDRGVFNDDRSLTFVSSLPLLTTRFSVCDCGSISGTCNVFLPFHLDTEQVFSFPPRLFFLFLTHFLSIFLADYDHEASTTSYSLLFSCLPLLHSPSQSLRSRQLLHNVFTDLRQIYISGSSSNPPSCGAIVSFGWDCMGTSFGFPSTISLFQGSSAGSGS